MRKIFTAAFLWLASLTYAVASQGSCVMPTTGTVSGLTLVNDINQCNSALLSLYSGAGAPSTPTTGMLWYNTTTNYIQQYDGASWINIWYVDSSNHLLSVQIGGGVSSATISSAGTTDLGTIPQPFKTISGTTTITSFGSTAPTGSIHVLKFSESLTLTYNVASMILPGGQNINTSSGAIALMLHLGSGSWQMLSWQPFGVSPQLGAYAFRGNNSGTRGDGSEITIPGLTNKASPVGADQFMIADSAASDAWKRITLSSLLSLISTPVGVMPLASGLVITNNSGTPNSIIDVTADKAAITDSSGQAKYLSSVSVSINSSTTGANGLDTGARASDTWYHVYVINNGSTTAGLLSLSSTSPTMPGGYTYATRFGAVRTDGSGNFKVTKQLGNRVTYTSSLPVMITGAAGFWTAVSVSPYIPPTATRILAHLVDSSPGSSGGAGVAPNPTSFPAGLGGGLCSSTSFFANIISNSQLCEMNLDSTNIYYGYVTGTSSAGTASLKAYGWVDKVNAN